MVGAHLDSVSVSGSPGADDNASGVAVLLETARLPAEAPVPTRVVLAVFDMEERGLIGARRQPANWAGTSVPRGVRRGDFTLVVHRRSLTAAASPSPANHLGRSDHAPFWNRGIPALMLTDTANFRNPHYHRSTDVPRTLDYDRLTAVTAATALTAASWPEPERTARSRR